ncbi:MAG: 3-deoxy-manno-octulosonate cytidylyltransferase [Magnetovibrio sp.]|nr:3-deoxy-manno-octulosonate cytidylyltransferase [Magnetovibrio sp.]MBH90281.1 3-deoxy-manno-octulosonate cytidylyltransferase [Magnetovibrio sp.]|tara:strand:- start:693 stop:1460 length:768 start_codon:yes stop_codon:yes gene_type:complete
MTENEVLHSSPINPLVVIPARMSSTRLPGKPLADINGIPMIVQVWRRAIEADVGPVVVACAEQEIYDAISDVGGAAVLTNPNHPSGSDRVYEALCAYDTGADFDVIINIQGDLPTIEPSAVRAVLQPLVDIEVDIATLVCEITDETEKNNPNVVKAVVSFPHNTKIGRALYFSRQRVPSGEGPLFQHIGLYAFRYEGLRRFIGLKPVPLERQERLEQLRAIEAGMRIDVALVDTVPLGVDTSDDLERARQILSKI